MKQLLVLFFLSFANIVLAQSNLINNPHFDTDTLDVDWPDGNNIGRSWISDDGALGNGCMEVPALNNNGGTFRFAYGEMLPVNAGEDYYIEAMTKVMGNSQAKGAKLYVWWRDINQNTIGLLQYVSIDEVFDSWEPILGMFTAHENAAFVSVYVGVATYNSGSPDPSIARFDDILFQADLIFKNDFEIISP